MSKQQKLFPKKIYCFDTSSLINLKPYRRDVFPTIWDTLKNMIKTDEIISPLEVYREIGVGKDEIYEWCKKNKKMFKNIDECQIQKFEDIKNRYVRDYWDTEINKTGCWADPWVIALNICEEASIVTDEKNVSNKIPYISNLLGARCLNLLDFFKEIGIKY